MSRVKKCLIMIVGLALIVPWGAWWKSQLALRSACRELRAVTRANESLRKALGDLTVVIVAKDREIDHLAHSPCEAGKEARPGSPITPDRQKANKSNAGI